MIYRKATMVLLSLFFMSCKTHEKSHYYVEPNFNEAYVPSTPLQSPTRLNMPSVSLLPLVEAKQMLDIPTNFSKMELAHVSAKSTAFFEEGSTTRIVDWSKEEAFSFPLPGAKVISHYGGRRRHGGIDLKTFPRDTIRSVFDGVVRMSKTYAAYGKVVVVRHASGVETVYSHNVKNLVDPRDTVRAGDALALVGRTGRATTEHLHFEIRINGTHINPEYFIDFEKRTLKKNRYECTLAGGRMKLKRL